MLTQNQLYQIFLLLLLLLLLPFYIIEEQSQEFSKWFFLSKAHSFTFTTHHITPTFTTITTTTDVLGLLDGAIKLDN